MSTVRVTQINLSSRVSFDDAIKKGIARANKTLKNVRGAWICNREVLIDREGKISEYRVQMKASLHSRRLGRKQSQQTSVKLRPIREIAGNISKASSCEMLSPAGSLYFSSTAAVAGFLVSCLWLLGQYDFNPCTREQKVWLADSQFYH